MQSSRSATLMILLPLWMLSTASCCGTCPDPVVPVTPPPKVVVRDPAPCHLPTLPTPLRLVGFPEADRIYVTKTDLADLGRYVLGLQSWIMKAAECLEGR